MNKKDNPAYHLRQPNKKNYGRFRPGIRYPEREATYVKKGYYHCYPSKEAYEAAKPEIERKKKLKAEKMARKESVAKEARNIQDLAREYSEKAMDALVRVMENENSPPSAVIQAAEIIHNRAYGKPTMTTINTNLNAEVKPSEIDDRTLEQRINNTLKRVENITERIPEETEGEERPSDLRIYN